MAKGSVVHFLTHLTPVAGCEACAVGAPRGRVPQKDKDILASMAALRDEFAQGALAAIITSSPPYPDPEASARMAYKFADAMMVARGPVPDPLAPMGAA